MINTMRAWPICCACLEMQFFNLGFKRIKVIALHSQPALFAVSCRGPILSARLPTLLFLFPVQELWQFVIG